MSDLFLHRWPAVTAQTRGSALLLHGLGEHAGRHAVTARWLIATGLEVLAPDLPGHGRSAGRRGDAASVDALVAALVPLWQGLDPARPRFLLGHSLGGLIALLLAARLDAQVDGLLLSSPFFGLAREPARWQQVMAGLFLRLAPALPLPTRLDPTALSHDPAVAAAYSADPLVHGKLSARLYASIRVRQSQLTPLASRIKVPVLHWHGDADALTSCPASVFIAQQWSHPRSQFFVVPGALHEVHNDSATPDVEARLHPWIRARLDAAGGAR